MPQTEEDQVFENLVPESIRSLIGSFSCGYGIPCRFCGWLYTDHGQLASAISETDWAKRKVGYPISISICTNLTGYFPEDLASWSAEHKAEEE